jgi:hypothetical protein
LFGDDSEEEELEEYREDDEEGEDNRSNLVKKMFYRDPSLSSKKK